MAFGDFSAAPVSGSQILTDPRFYSDPPSDSGLAKPEVPPALPPIPTSSLLADADREADELKQLENADRLVATLAALREKNDPDGPKLPAPGKPAR